MSKRGASRERASPRSPPARAPPPLTGGRAQRRGKSARSARRAYGASAPLVRRGDARFRVVGVRVSGALNDRSRDGSEAAKAALSALLPARGAGAGGARRGGDSETAGRGLSTTPASYCRNAVLANEAATCATRCSRFVTRGIELTPTRRYRRVHPDAAAAIVARDAGDARCSTPTTFQCGAKTKSDSSTKETVPETVPPRGPWALLRLVPHCDRGAEAWAATSEAAAWALGVLEGAGTRNVRARDDDDRENEACLAERPLAIARRVSSANQSDENSKETVKVSPETVAYGVARAVRAAGHCPGVCQAAADALGAIRSRTRRWRRGSWRGSTTKNKPRLAKKTDETRRAKRREKTRHRLRLFSRLCTPISRRFPCELTGAFEARARRGALAFLCDMSAAVGECGFEWDRGLVRDVCGGGRHAKQSRRGSASVAGRQRARAADATRSGVMEYAKTSQVAIASITRFCESDAFEPGGPSRWRCARFARPGSGSPRSGRGSSSCSAQRRRRPTRARRAALFAAPRGGTARVPGRARRRDERGGALRAPTAARGRRRGWVEVESEAEEEAGDETLRSSAFTDTKPVNRNRNRNRRGRAQRGFGVARASVERLLPRGAGCRSVDSVRYPGSVRRGVAASRRLATAAPAGAAFPFFRRRGCRADGARRSGKAWRNGLREWLRLLRDALGGGRSLKALERGIGSEIRRVLRAPRQRGRELSLRWRSGVSDVGVCRICRRKRRASSTRRRREDHEARAHQLKPHG